MVVGVSAEQCLYSGCLILTRMTTSLSLDQSSKLHEQGCQVQRPGWLTGFAGRGAWHTDFTSCIH